MQVDDSCRSGRGKFVQPRERRVEGKGIYSLDAYGAPIVRLRQPTDFLVLEALHSYGRNVAPNLAEVTGKSRKNVNNRLPVLDDYGLVRKIGPADRSGLYEITERGRVALQLRDQYDTAEDFDALVDRRVDSQSASAATAEASVRGGSDAEEHTEED